MIQLKVVSVVRLVVIAAAAAAAAVVVVGRVRSWVR
jgi:hypothetical protein